MGTTANRKQVQLQDKRLIHHFVQFFQLSCFVSNCSPSLHPSPCSYMSMTSIIALFFLHGASLFFISFMLTLSLSVLHFLGSSYPCHSFFYHPFGFSLFSSFVTLLFTSILVFLLALPVFLFLNSTRFYLHHKICFRKLVWFLLGEE